MLVKIIVIAAMIAIIVALSSGLIFLVRDKGQSKSTIRALTWRISLSLLLFIFLFLAYNLNWIAPHGIG
ncbi:MAG: twin transmembrane helix small protein [Legionellales bacterium]|nr:twin transmembrane helix small protein [Legionellales bacterium]